MSGVLSRRKQASSFKEYRRQCAAGREKDLEEQKREVDVRDPKYWDTCATTAVGSTANT